jgi:hypothetical protein
MLPGACFMHCGRGSLNVVTGSCAKKSRRLCHLPQRMLKCCPMKLYSMYLSTRMMQFRGMRGRMLHISCSTNFSLGTGNPCCSSMRSCARWKGSSCMKLKLRSSLLLQWQKNACPVWCKSSIAGTIPQLALCSKAYAHISCVQVQRCCGDHSSARG